MGVSIFNTALRDHILQYAEGLEIAGISVTNVLELTQIVTGPDTITHRGLARYICYSSASNITIQIPDGEKNGFVVSDADRTWHTEPLIIQWLDAGGVVINSEIINDRNETYRFFEVDGVWYKQREGRGLTDAVHP